MRESIILGSQNEEAQTYVSENWKPASCINECYYIFYNIIYNFTIIPYNKNEFLLLEVTRVYDHPKQLAGPVINKHQKEWLITNLNECIGELKFIREQSFHSC
jgi:hypothetical protein